MNLYYKLDENKNAVPCPIDELEHTHVGDEEINGKRISTVFLGINHAWDFGDPILFETMIFNDDGESIYCKRYSTWAEAEEGHKEAIELVKNGDENER